MAYKRFKKLANIIWKKKAWQKNTLMKAPIQLSNNSSISRPHPASWGQSYLPLWSHAAAKYIPPWKASKVHQKSGIRPTVRSRLLPSLLHSPSFPTHALPHPSSTHAHNPLLSMLCLGVCPLFFFKITKDFKQHFPQQERIPPQTDVLQHLMTGANHTSSLTKIPEHSSHPPCLTLPRQEQHPPAPTATSHTAPPVTSSCGGKT